MNAGTKKGMMINLKYLYYNGTISQVANALKMLLAV